jgi:HlyD family secretion protein
MQISTKGPVIRRAIGVVVVVAIVAGLWSWLGRKSGPLVTYETATVDKGVVEKAVSSTGSVAALITVEVGSQISGQVAELHADFNTQVKKGDLLAVIDPQTYKSRVLSAEADVAVARANVGTQEANLRKAQTSLDQADRDYKRQQALAEQKLVSTSAVETALKTLELARGDLDVSRAQLTNAQAAIRTKQAALDQARIDLSRTQIRSPIDGVVIKRAIDRGQTVAASLQAPVLFQIAEDLSRIQIETKVDEADIGSIKPDNVATFTVDAFPDQNFQGRVAQVRLAATTVQNVVTYSVMVQAPNPRQVLLPGMTANVRIVTDRRENVLRVPNDAARFQPAGASGPRAGGGAAPVAGLGGPPGGGGGQGGGFGGQNAQLTEELGLTKEQQAKLDKGRRELFAQVRAQAQQGGGLAGGGGFPPPGGGGFPGGGPNDQQGQAMRARFENLMRSVLNEEQMKKWQAQRSARGGAGGVRVRPGTLYTLDGKEPKVHQVRVGLADDRYTELANGDLKEGDAVIVKSHTELRK